MAGPAACPAQSRLPSRPREFHPEPLTNSGREPPHDEIVRVIAAKIESCRKLILASRVSMAGDGIVFAAMFLGAIRFDPAAMAAAVAALLAGIVVWGSNGSTAKEAARELAARLLSRSARA